ncbi:hypothetical protein TNCT_67311 [Trichonephila clavata]|uniref:Uncharacterized protein n=1 Tax=Trichonephila clavata TaxID=2740835 RepID=A0A8X6I2A5_TRICU|nr:hypothetical protein TNCT_67311 [Trichonephila clavata]
MRAAYNGPDNIEKHSSDQGIDYSANFHALQTSEFYPRVASEFELTTRQKLCQSRVHNLNHSPTVSPNSRFSSNMESDIYLHYRRCLPSSASVSHGKEDYFLKILNDRKTFELNYKMFKHITFTSFT